MKRRHTGHVNHAEGSLRYWYGQFMCVSRQCKPSVHPQGDSILEGLVKQLYIIHRLDVVSPSQRLRSSLSMTPRPGPAAPLASALSMALAAAEISQISAVMAAWRFLGQEDVAYAYAGELLVLSDRTVPKCLEQTWELSLAKLSSLSWASCYRPTAASFADLDVRATGQKKASNCAARLQGFAKRNCPSKAANLNVALVVINCLYTNYGFFAPACSTHFRHTIQ